MVRMTAARSRVLQNLLFAALAAAGLCLTVAAAAAPLPQESGIVDEMRTGDPLDILLSPRPHAGLALGPGWNLLATVSHRPNSGVCDQNQGLTSAGVQLGYRW